MQTTDDPGVGGASCCFVLVHGILSDGHEAWEQPPAGGLPAMREMAAGLVQELGPDTPAGMGVHAITYRWELGVRSGAMELHHCLGALAQTVAGPIYLIGHSMGGLVCRYYLERLSGKPGWQGQRVAALTTLATPHRGSQLYVRSVALLKSLPLTHALGDVAAALEAGLVVSDALTPEALAHVQFLADLMPGSEVLRELNSPFTPPPSTTYIAAGVPDDLIVMDYQGEILQGFQAPAGAGPLVRPAVDICRDETVYAHPRERVQHARHSSLNYNQRFAGWLAAELRRVHAQRLSAGQG